MSASSCDPAAITVGIPVISAVCLRSVILHQLRSKVHTMTVWIQPFVPIFNSSITSPLLRSKMYIVPWSLPMTMALHSSAKETCRTRIVLLIATGYVRTLAPDCRRNRAAPCAGSSMQKTFFLTFMSAFPLYHVSISSPSKSCMYIMLPIWVFCCTSPSLALMVILPLIRPKPRGVNSRLLTYFHDGARMPVHPGSSYPSVQRRLPLVSLSPERWTIYWSIPLMVRRYTAV
jgi:hypothetical protein